MVVSGCFWACPSSVILIDFSTPLLESAQIDINEFINQDYDYYDDINFVAWEGTDLVLEMNSQAESVQKELRTISSEEYMMWFENAKIKE